MRLLGEAPFQPYLDRALEAASSTWGVRRVESQARVVEPPPVPVPSATDIETRDTRPVIAGTWGSALSTGLKVTVGETAYVLGTAPELTADGDSLRLATPLADGTYDIGVEASDKYGRTAALASPARLLVDATPPATPTVTPVTAALPPYTVSGTWGDGDAASLSVALGGRTWQLGRDSALVSDGKGNWTLTPDISLAPGTYDVVAESADRLGNVAAVTVPGALTIEVVPELVAPTVESLLSGSATPEIRGTWPQQRQLQRHAV